MSIPQTPFDPRVRMGIGSSWEDVTLRVSQADGQFVEIQTGNEDEALGDEINPGRCTLTFQNTDGAFVVDNPMSPYYPHLNTYTPICVLLDEIWDTFSRVDNDSWNDTDTGETYQTTGVGAPLNATDYSTDGSTGIHSVPTTVAYRMSYLGSTSRAPLAYNIIQKVRFKMNIGNVTGGNIEPANLVCRLISTSQYYLCRLEVTTAEVLTLTIMRNDSVVLAGPVTVPGITYTANMEVWVQFGACQNDLFATAWTGDAIENEPTGWLVTATDSTYGYGYYGIRTGVGSGNTNTKPIVVQYDNYRVYVSEFNGEVAQFPQGFSDDGTNRTVPIVAGGVLRRYSETKPPLLNVARRLFEKGFLGTPLPLIFWPMDEGELALEARATRGPTGYPFVFNYALGALVGVDTSNEKHFAQGKQGVWLPNGIEVLPTDILQMIAPKGVLNTAPSARWAVSWARTGGSGTSDSFIMSGAFADGVTWGGLPSDVFSIDCNSSTLQITVNPGFFETPVVIDATTLPTNVFDGAVHIFRFFTSTNGTDLTWGIQIDGHTIDDANVLTGHPFIASFVLFQITSITPVSGFPSKPTTFSCVAIYTNDDPTPSDQIIAERFFGQLGEPADNRVQRLSREENIPIFQQVGNGRSMGPQFDDSLFSHFEEALRTDGGIIRELLGARSYYFDTLESLRTRSVQVTLNVGNAELATGGFHPTRDNQRLRNQIRASRRGGADYTWTKTDGRLGTNTVGVVGDETNVNPELESDLIEIAQREVAEGTVDAPRYPIVSVDLGADVIRNNLTLRRQVLNTFVSQRMKLTGMSGYYHFRDADLLVIGMLRQLSPFMHKVSWNTIPFSTLDTFHVETAGSVLGTDSSFIVNSGGINSSTTSFNVITQGDALWTTSGGSFPIVIDCEGEDITLTGVTTTAPAFRSVGAASHGDNATTTPGLPAGHAANDTLVLVSVIRNTSATANLPAGYSMLFNFGHLIIACKNDNGAESAPNCTYSGGAAGDTTSAVLVALQNVKTDWPQAVGQANQSNSSAQNINIPSRTPLQCNGIELIIGWKQDDYTSVQPPIWITEIGEFSTTTGNDQSLYLGYHLEPRVAPTPADTLVVTGGASAISKGIVVHFSNPQQFTCTRSANGVVKSHSQLAPVKIAYPKVLG